MDSPTNLPQSLGSAELASFRHFFARTGGGTGFVGMTTGNFPSGLRQSSKVVISPGQGMTDLWVRRRKGG